MTEQESSSEIDQNPDDWTSLFATTEPATSEETVEVKSLESEPAESDAEPAQENQEPTTPTRRMTRLEQFILKAAIRIITERKEPVPYRELLNDVYMELVDKKIEFDTARQIETTLLDHHGREILLVDEPDEDGIKMIRKWWLGGKQLSEEKHHSIPGLKTVRAAGSKLPGISKIRRKPEEAHYVRRKLGDDEEDSGSRNLGRASRQ